MNVLAALLICVLALAARGWAQNTPCSSKDPGPFLSTPPSLTMTVHEASQQELAADAGGYRAEVRLYGEEGGQGSDGIVLEVMPDYTFMNPEDSFRFTHDQGVNYLQMYRPVDRDGPTDALDDDINVFSFTLKCSLHANMSDFVFYTTKILVLDVNDNDPQFVSLTSSLILNELTPPGLSVLTAKAMDLDISSNLTFAIVPRPDLADDMSSFFAVDRLSGQLTVSTDLDYETMAQGSLVLSVQDGGSLSRITSATVTVTVEDGDDQGPVFVYPGCWTHKARCAWPKYTTTTSLTQGRPISVMPVPNKVQSSVLIRAKDLDYSANPVVFSIASTIPPGQESLFTVSTSQTGSGEYVATITPTSTTRVNHGFEIFLQAEEQSQQKRFEVAMIFFEAPGHVCASGTSSAQTGTASPPEKAGSGGGDDKESGEDSEEKYTEPVIALIVVVSILAALLLCLALAFFCSYRGARFATASPARHNDVVLTTSHRNGRTSL